VAYVTGGAGVDKYLADLAKKIESGKSLRVGFLEGSNYPDGTSVPMVAAIQNFGAPAAGIPPRPFFTDMIRKQSPQWGYLFERCMAITKNDTAAALGLMGQIIADQLKTSIEETDSPPLSPVTLMLRKMRMENPDLIVTGATVGEAARRVASGESTAGVKDTVLQDTNTLHDAVNYEVDTGE